MLVPEKISLLGGDLRQVYLANRMDEHGFLVSVYGMIPSDLLSPSVTVLQNLRDAVTDHPILICPTPFTKDKTNLFCKDHAKSILISDLLSFLTPNHLLCGGNIPSYVTKDFADKNIPFYDFMKEEEISILNAIATAEGSIAEAIKRSPINLHKQPCLILGFGRCGKVLAKKLLGLDMDVTVFARKKEDRALAFSYGYSILSAEELPYAIGNFSYLFNTIPTCFLSSSLLLKLPSDCTILDLASAPGGMDRDAAHDLHLNATLLPGLPGIYSPKTSADIMFHSLLTKLDEYAVSRGGLELL